jgi:hypothetical protein
MSFIPDSNTVLKSPSQCYAALEIPSQGLSPYTPYERSPNDYGYDYDHELRPLEAGYNVSPVRSPRRSFCFIYSSYQVDLLEPTPLVHAGRHVRNSSKGSIVRLSPTECVILTNETDLEFWGGGRGGFRLPRQVWKMGTWD